MTVPLGLALATLFAFLLIVVVLYRRRRTVGPAVTGRRDQVAFSVYRPETASRESEVSVLAYAHLAEVVPAPGGESVIVVPQAVESDAQRHFQDVPAPPRRIEGSTGSSVRAVGANEELTFHLDVGGCDVSPSEQTLRWERPFRVAPFRVLIPPDFGAPRLDGMLTVSQGLIVRGRVEFSISLEGENGDHRVVGGRTYDKVFASYSHLDSAVVDRVQETARALGHEYLRDVLQLRTGDDWEERVEGLIREADLFQLFWSAESMRSEQVRKEWEFALALGRPKFVLPVYWEVPLPRDEARALPPAEIARLHFARISLGPASEAHRERVFLSYDPDDREAAEFLAAKLEEQGWSVWWAQAAPPGMRYEDFVSEKLDEARCVVVLWSSRSVESEAVAKEAGRALERGRLVAALIDEVVPPSPFRGIAAPSLVDWDGAPSGGFEDLIAAIERCVGQQGQTRARSPRPSPLRKLAGTAAVAALAGVIGTQVLMTGARPSGPDQPVAASPPVSADPSDPLAGAGMPATGGDQGVADRPLPEPARQVPVPTRPPPAPIRPPPEVPSPSPAAAAFAPLDVAIDVFARLKAAMEAEDIARVRAVYPGMPDAEQTRNSFEFMSDLQVTYEIGAIDVIQAGERFEVTVVTTYEFAEEQAPLSAGTQVYTLQRSGTRWSIPIAARDVR